MVFNPSTRRFAGALLITGLLATSAASSVSAQAARGPSAERSQGRVSLAAATTSLQTYSKRRLLTIRRVEAKKPQPQPQPQPQPAPLPPPPVPPVAVAGGFGVSFDNAEYIEATVRNRELDAMAAMGADWVRFDIKWSDVQWEGQSSFNWSKYDPLIDAARSRGMTVLGNLAYSPTWARPTGTSDKFGPNTDERRRAYATFAEAAVRHFAGRVSHWELWNEPNIPMFWAPQPNASHYTLLIREAYPRVKAANPAAYVLAGSTSPASTNGVAIDEVAFLQAVYANGGAGRFDGWSHHPYTVDPSFAHADNAWWQIAHTSPSIRSVMTANGDGAKQVWGTEFGPPTAGSPNAVSEAGQAAQMTEAYTTWNAYSWAGPLFVYGQRDKRAYGTSTDSFDFYGMLRNDFSTKPAWGAYRALAT